MAASGGTTLPQGGSGDVCFLALSLLGCRKMADPSVRSIELARTTARSGGEQRAFFLRAHVPRVRCKIYFATHVRSRLFRESASLAHVGREFRQFAFADEVPPRDRA